MLILLHFDKLQDSEREAGATQTQPSPIEWCTTNHGENSDHIIVIPDCELFARKILPEFGFESISTASFTRKMYRWGFRQPCGVHTGAFRKSVSQSRTRHMYESKYFRKDKLALLSQMTSKTAEKDRTKSAKGEAEEQGKNDEAVMRSTQQTKRLGGVSDRHRSTGWAGPTLKKTRNSRTSGDLAGTNLVDDVPGHQRVTRCGPEFSIPPPENVALARQLVTNLSAAQRMDNQLQPLPISMQMAAADTSFPETRVAGAPTPLYGLIKQLRTNHGQPLLYSQASMNLLPSISTTPARTPFPVNSSPAPQFLSSMIHGIPSVRQQILLSRPQMSDATSSRSLSIEGTAAADHAALSMPANAAPGLREYCIQASMTRQTGLANQRAVTADSLSLGPGISPFLVSAMQLPVPPLFGATDVSLPQARLSVEDPPLGDAIGGSIFTGPPPLILDDISFRRLLEIRSRRDAQQRAQCSQSAFTRPMPPL
jgi:HSF-type DNA-binding